MEISQTDQDFYTVLLDADPRIKLSFTRAAEELQQFCTQNNARIWEFNEDNGECVVLMSADVAEVMKKQEFVSQLPIPGNQPAVIRGISIDHDDAYSPGLTA